MNTLEGCLMNSYSGKHTIHHPPTLLPIRPAIGHPLQGMHGPLQGAPHGMHGPLQGGMHGPLQGALHGREEPLHGM